MENAGMLEAIQRAASMAPFPTGRRRLFEELQRRATEAALEVSLPGMKPGQLIAWPDAMLYLTLESVHAAIKTVIVNWDDTWTL